MGFAGTARDGVLPVPKGLPAIPFTSSASGCAMPPASSDEILRELVELGISPKTIVTIAQLLASDQQESARRERNRDRMRLVRERARTQAHSSAQSPPHTPPLPSIDVPSGTSISGRVTRKPKIPLPETWNPIVAEADAAELQRFRDYAKANGKLYADWDAAWRNWKTSPYRKPNGGHSNGRPQRHASQVAYDLADEWRRREADIERGGLFGAADNARSTRSGG